MSCSTEEIAEKRRLALERLKNKNSEKSPSKVPPSVNLPFYGKHSPNEKKIVVDNYINAKHDNKMKTKSPFKDHRIYSQPYSTSAEERHKNSDVKKTNNLAPIFVKTITCTCSMVNELRFVVIINSYSEKVFNMFKTIPSKIYDPTSKNWTFLLKDYSLFIEKMTLLKPDVTVSPIPKYVLKVFETPQKAIDCSYLKSIEPSLENTLLQFQKEGVCFGIQKQGRCMIADDMGLGKTYQAIALADYYKADWPVLICTTASTRDAWALKIRTLLPTVACHNIVCMTTHQDYFGEAKILILSYALMEKNYEKLMEKNFGVIILDESHTLKNSKAKCTLVALRLSKRAKRVILLTGTPALSRPSELFTQLQMVDKNFLKYTEYIIRYCEGKQTTFGWDATGQSNLTELNLLLNQRFMIRRTKDKVLSQLKDKNRETVTLDSALIYKNDENSEQEKNLQSFALKYSKNVGRKREEILLQFYSETAKVKTKAVCAYIKNVLKENKKFIIFAHHKVMLNAITEYLRGLHVDYVRIDGSTKNEYRTEYIKYFQMKETCKVAVLSLKACNSGITLTAAQLVIFAELDWNPSTLSQAESRVHRIGQEGDVTIRYLLATGTADDIIWNLLKTKQSVLNKAGLCNEDFGDATKTIEKSSAGNIEGFLTKFNNNVGETSGKYQKTTLKEENKYKNLLLDDDDDFADLDF